jgi:hypothetical protein
VVLLATDRSSSQQYCSSSQDHSHWQHTKYKGNNFKKSDHNIQSRDKLQAAMALLTTAMKPEVRSKSLTSRSLQQVPSLAMEQNRRGFVPSLGVSGFETQAAAFCMKSKRISTPVPSQIE